MSLPAAGQIVRSGRKKDFAYYLMFVISRLQMLPYGILCVNLASLRKELSWFPEFVIFTGHHEPIKAGTITEPAFICTSDITE